MRTPWTTWTCSVARVCVCIWKMLKKMDCDRNECTLHAAAIDTVAVFDLFHFFLLLLLPIAGDVGFVATSLHLHFFLSFSSCSLYRFLSIDRKKNAKPLLLYSFCTRFFMRSSAFLSYDIVSMRISHRLATTFSNVTVHADWTFSKLIFTLTYSYSHPRLVFFLMQYFSFSLCVLMNFFVLNHFMLLCVHFDFFSFFVSFLFLNIKLIYNIFFFVKRKKIKNDNGNAYKYAFQMTVFHARTTQTVWQHQFTSIYPSR